MPNKSKIVGELEIIVREMCEKGYNATHIGKQVGVSKDTVGAWAIKNGFVLSKRKSDRILDLIPQIEEMLLQGKKRKEIQKTLKVSYDNVTEIATRMGLVNSLRDRKEAALDKILSEDEVKKRIPDNSEYIGYISSKKKYGFKCKKTGKLFYKSSAKIEQGSPFDKSGGLVTEETYIDRLKLVGHKLIPGTYTRMEHPAIVTCPKGHVRRLEKAVYAIKFECSVCGNNGTSKGEIELFDWIKQYYPSVMKYKFPIRKTRPKEIDIFIPELNLGIEYCGLYFHKESELKEENADDNKHYKKMLEANSLGIRLITIFEDEWKQKKEQIKGFLLSTIQKNSVRIYARECKTKEINTVLSNMFMEEHHIQGSGTKTLVSYGIYHKDELLGVMTGGSHPQRSSENDEDLYLTRLAFKQDVTIVGGSSKLFRQLKNYGVKNGYKSIVSWSDNRWSEGGVYKALGFQFQSEKEKGKGLMDGSIWPTAFFIFRGKKHTIESIKNMGLNEMGLSKIYDCGKKRWIFDLKCDIL